MSIALCLQWGARSFTGFGLRCNPKFSGGDIEEVPPDPIPNSEVKLFGADGTAPVTVWESRSLPDFFTRSKPRGSRFEAFFIPWVYFDDARRVLSRHVLRSDSALKSPLRGAPAWSGEQSGDQCGDVGAIAKQSWPLEVPRRA